MAPKLRARVASALAGLTVALLALGSAQAMATTFGEKEFTCPIGGQKFKAHFVTSTSQFGMRLDLRPQGTVPIGALLTVCPDNGFVMYKAEFSEAEIGKLTPIVLSEEYQRARAGNTSHYMVALMQERMGAGEAELAWLYLHASWEAEIHLPHLTERYRRLALAKLEAALARNRQWDLVLIAAELERLLGRFDAAEARLAAVPGEVLNAGQSKALEQIRHHARSRNAEPQDFVAK